MDGNLKRITLVCNTSNSVLTFRRKLIETLQNEGYEVSVIAFDNQREAEIKAMGVEFHCVEDANRSLNPFRILTLTGRYKKLIKEVSPDIVLTFMLKPNIFGVKAAKKLGIKNIYSFVDGVGDVFINNSLKWKIIRFVVCKLYKSSFKYSKKVFFPNKDDKLEFIQRKLITQTQGVIVEGTGIDLEKFSFKPLKNRKSFLMIARMLKTKGVFEYCEAARIVKAKYPEAEFHYVGPEGTVKIADIQSYIEEGIVCYLGATTDVRPYIEDCTVHVLPSYREGQGQVSLEAGAMGRALIVCDTNGSRDTVQDGYNGFLVEVKSAQQIAEKMIWFIENPEKTEEMGKNARKFAEEKFDSVKINEKILSIIESELE